MREKYVLVTRHTAGVNKCMLLIYDKFCLVSNKTFYLLKKNNEKKKNPFLHSFQTCR